VDLTDMFKETSSCLKPPCCLEVERKLYNFTRSPVKHTAQDAHSRLGFIVLALLLS